MKFHIYNPGPQDYPFNPICNKFHLTTTNPMHCYDCYREEQRVPLSSRCTDRILELAEPRVRSKKYEKELWPYTRTTIVRETKVSSRLEHLAHPIFRRVFTTKQHLEHRPNIREYVKKNLNCNIQRSMYNIYSRLGNVKFPNIPASKRKPVKLSGEEYERRMKQIERLSQPRKIPKPEIDKIVVKKEDRPVSMATMERLAIPRKTKAPEEFIYSLPSRPLQSIEYYEKLSEPRKIVEEIMEPGPILQSMERTLELATPVERLKKRKFMKGDNEIRFSVSRAALQYQASAKIIKLAVPRAIPADPNETVVKSKSKKK